MAKRKIIKIDLEKCNGCALCIPQCPEGALQIIDGKARLVSDLCCDGLGACIGHCPKGAIKTEEREAEDYNEKKVMENIVGQGENVIKAHLKHLKEHHQEEYLKQAVDYLRDHGRQVPALFGQVSGQAEPCACPSAKVIDLRKEHGDSDTKAATFKMTAELKNWPIQLMLLPVSAAYLKEADLLIAADCTAFACANFHADFLKDKILVVACPKLDNREIYREKLKAIFQQNNLKKVTCVHMEVPCCFGLVTLIQEAIQASGKLIVFEEINFSIKGERL